MPTGPGPGVRKTQAIQDPARYRRKMEDEAAFAEFLRNVTFGFIHVHPDDRDGGTHNHGHFGFHTHHREVAQWGETIQDGLERAGYLEPRNRTQGDYLARYRTEAERLLIVWWRGSSSPRTSSPPSTSWSSS